MITSKQRKKLSGLGQKIDAIFQIGKNGLSDSLVNELSNALEARELIKISVLNNSQLKAKEVIGELANALGAEPISCVGSKIVLYRKSTKDIKHIELD
ncbi:MAG: YhbY family RNA-binding protein [Clostridiales bacterium]|nr:YhbY family RNA-binding protein [Clostridiales bacterium]